MKEYVGIAVSINFGTEGEEKFISYVGLNVEQKKDVVQVDEENYLETLEVPSLEGLRFMREDETLGPEGQTEFRSAVEKVQGSEHCPC